MIWSPRASRASCSPTSSHLTRPRWAGGNFPSTTWAYSPGNLHMWFTHSHYTASVHLTTFFPPVIIHLLWSLHQYSQKVSSSPLCSQHLSKDTSHLAVSICLPVCLLPEAVSSGAGDCLLVLTASSIRVPWPCETAVGAQIIHERKEGRRKE